MVQLNGKAPPPTKTPATSFGGGLAGLLHDLVRLTELQVKLLGVDTKEMLGRLIFPVAFLAAGGIFVLCALPLGLVAISYVLRYQAGWPPALSMLLALGIGLALGGLLLLVGFLLLRRSLRPVGRSREELQRNVDWLKMAIRRLESRAATREAAETERS